MKTQNLAQKYTAIYKFHRSYGICEALSRVFSIFKELDLFDLRRKINTRTIKVEKLEKDTYMPYWPTFTSVANEMIRFSHNYYISAIRYSDLGRKTVFVDFGSGLGKNPIIAAESRKFDICGGLEIDLELTTEAHKNLAKIRSSRGRRFDKSQVFFLTGNVEEAKSINNLVAEIKNKGIEPSLCTLFIYNKNSYGPDVMRKSIDLVEKEFNSIVYLYQNPIHQYVLREKGFIEFGADDKPNTAHKNFKYRLYFKHKYAD